MLKWLMSCYLAIESVPESLKTSPLRRVEEMMKAAGLTEVISTAAPKFVHPDIRHKSLVTSQL